LVTKYVASNVMLLFGQRELLGATLVNGTLVNTTVSLETDTNWLALVNW